MNTSKIELELLKLKYEHYERTAKESPKELLRLRGEMEQGDMLTISFRGRKVLLLLKSVVARGVKEYGGGVAVNSHIKPEILRDLN